MQRSLKIFFYNFLDAIAAKTANQHEIYKKAMMSQVWTEVYKCLIEQKMLPVNSGKHVVTNGEKLHDSFIEVEIFKPFK